MMVISDNDEGHYGGRNWLHGNPMQGWDYRCIVTFPLASCFTGFDDAPAAGVGRGPIAYMSMTIMSVCSVFLFVMSSTHFSICCIPGNHDIPCVDTQPKKLCNK